MFELEVGTTTLAPDALPVEARAAFIEARRAVTAYALTPWKEHCTECAMPACYASCDLYAPRRDGKCRRFRQGIETVPLVGHPQGYVAKVTFKRWGQLMAYANTRLIRAEEAAAIERRVRRVESVAAAWPGGSISLAGRRGIPSRLAGRWKQRLSVRAGRAVAGEPESLLIEVFNPGSRPVSLSVSVANPGRPPFQARIELLPGFQAVEVPVAGMRRAVDLDDGLRVALDPNITRPEDEGLTLYFGLVAFVTHAADRSSPDPAPKPTGAAGEPVKVAVWDLDETLWSGVLVEDGLEGIQVRDEVIAVVREMDQRGIVNSVLSKNNRHDALEALGRLGIDELFVRPEIGWADKGATMASLIRGFGLSPGSFAFIDDQAFERAEVIAANPGVRVYDPRDLHQLLDLPEFNPVRSAESSARRGSYRAEEQRDRARATFGGEYVEFLRTCDLRVDISGPDAGSLARIHELVQRTNQLNFSGRHYSREEIAALVGDGVHESFVVACSDVYGDYGTVGFVLVDLDEAYLRDAMFSCRVQFKHVEHAVLSFLLDRYRARAVPWFRARFHETARNGPAVAVFDELGFQELSRQGPERVFGFDLQQAVPDEGIVAVTYQGATWQPSEPLSGS